MRKILIATNNPGKIRELKELLKDLPLKLVNLDEAAPGFEVKETGETFKENAILKAMGCAKKTGFLTVADDSGLEIDALDKKPGVYSARCFGDVSQEDKNQNILEMMKDIPEEKRNARFQCVFAIGAPAGKIKTAGGTMEGRISFESKGENGFGYDPIFIPKGFTKTNAELTIEEKNEISHRGKALRKAIEILKGIINARY